MVLPNNHMSRNSCLYNIEAGLHAVENITIEYNPEKRIIEIVLHAKLKKPTNITYLLCIISITEYGMRSPYRMYFARIMIATPSSLASTATSKSCRNNKSLRKLIYR